MVDAYLQSRRALGDDVRRLLEGPGGLHLPLGGDDLGAGLPGGLGLGRHGPLQLHRQPHVLTADVTHKALSKARGSRRVPTHSALPPWCPSYPPEPPDPTTREHHCQKSKMEATAILFVLQFGLTFRLVPP